MDTISTLDANVTNKFRKLLFGLDQDVNLSRVVIAPMSLIYNPLVEILDKSSAHNYRGWWECTAGTVNNKPVLIAYAKKQGPAIRDAVRTLTGPDTGQRFLVGYAGALSKDIEIGDVVVATKAYNAYDTLEVIEAPQLIHGVPAKSIASIDAFTDETEQMLRYLGDIRKIDLLDMETFHFYRAGMGENGGEDCSLLVVSDTRAKPVYECGKPELEKINLGLTKAISLMRDTLSQKEILPYDLLQLRNST